MPVSGSVQSQRSQSRPLESQNSDWEAPADDRHSHGSTSPSAVRVSTPDTDVAAVAYHSYRVARGTTALLPDHEMAPAIKAVKSAKHPAARMDGNLVDDIWLTTSGLRHRSHSSSLVQVPLTEVDRFIALLRGPIERLGLRFGIDLIIYGVLETTHETNQDQLSDGDIETLVYGGSTEAVQVPADHHEDAW